MTIKVSDSDGSYHDVTGGIFDSIRENMQGVRVLLHPDEVKELRDAALRLYPLNEDFGAGYQLAVANGALIAEKASEEEAKVRAIATEDSPLVNEQVLDAILDIEEKLDRDMVLIAYLKSVGAR